MIITFYFTSGWITGINNKPISPNELLKKRIKQLGVPYFWFSLLIIAFDVLWVLFGFMDSGILLRDIYKTIVLRGIGTLWFLPVLIIGEYIFAVVRNSKRQWLLAAILMAITLVTNYAYNNLWLPMWELSELNKLIDVPIDIYYINGVLSNTLPAIAFMCLFAVFTKNIITGFFTYWGVNSLILMCTHFSITMEILMAFDKYMLHHPVFEGPVTILYFAVCILLTYPLVNLFNGKLRFMIGK